MMGASTQNVRYYFLYMLVIAVPVVFVFYFLRPIIRTNFVELNPYSLLFLTGVISVPVSIFSKRSAGFLLTGCSVAIWAMLLFVFIFFNNAEVYAAYCFSLEIGMEKHANLGLALVMVPMFISGYGMLRLNKMQKGSLTRRGMELYLGRKRKSYEQEQSGQDF